MVVSAWRITILKLMFLFTVFAAAGTGISTGASAGFGETQIAQSNPAPETSEPSQPEATDGDTAEDTIPPIIRDLDRLPFPVRRMRELILEAAREGNIEKLRQLIGSGDDITMLSLGGPQRIEGAEETDPLDVLKSQSGDEEGYEILAIMSEVLEAGFVVMDPGSEDELYVWPYFFAWPLDKLNAAQKVELYRLVTFGDYQDMESFGAYIFYRLGITREGRWRFFVAGD